MSKHTLSDSEKDGKKISPVLKQGIKNFLIDIDGTICEDIPNEEPERMATAALYEGAVEKINEWYDQGHIITFFTSRTEAHREVTEKYLRDNGFKFHGLLVGKPRGGNYHWIDNHPIQATQYLGKFTDLEEKQGTIQVFKK
ncbi:MAG: phosphoheptose isomerase [Bacteroidia bacterium]|nr:phosphoheptose isomerase [Bacteroidia bacterium]